MCGLIVYLLLFFFLLCPRGVLSSRLENTVKPVVISLLLKALFMLTEKGALDASVHSFFKIDNLIAAFFRQSH